MLQIRDRFPMPIRRPLIAWTPIPLAQPILDPDVARLPALRRAAVILHYRVVALEYALSPCGALRAFIRLCTLLGLAIGLPVLLILPPLILLIYGLADIAAAIAEACLSILKALVTVIGIVVICGVLIAMFKRK